MFLKRLGVRLAAVSHRQVTPQAWNMNRILVQLYFKRLSHSRDHSAIFFKIRPIPVSVRPLPHCLAPNQTLNFESTPRRLSDFSARLAATPPTSLATVLFCSVILIICCINSISCLVRVAM